MAKVTQTESAQQNRRMTDFGASIVRSPNFLNRSAFERVQFLESAKDN